MVIEYDKAVAARLRQIPVEIVRERLGLPEIQSSRIKNGIDVLIHQSRLEFGTAIEKLAELFPEIASGAGLTRDVNSKCARDRRAEAGVDEKKSLKRTMNAIIRQFEAFGIERCHVFVQSPEGFGNYSSKRSTDKKQGYPDGMNLETLLQKELGHIARLNVNGGNVFFSPIHPENRISIPVDDVSNELVKNFRPSILMATSDRSRQAHYLIFRKYESEFYDYLTKVVNERWGDPKITTASHDTRLAGFTNRKRPCLHDSTRFPFVEILESNPLRCEGFESMADDLYEEWKEDEQEQQNVAEKLAIQEIGNGLHFVSIPENIDFRAKQYKKNLEIKYSGMFDRSRGDFMICKKMHEANIDSNIIYSWLMSNACQTDELVERVHSDGTVYTVRKNTTREALDRYVRRTVTHAAKEVERELQIEEDNEEEIENEIRMTM